MNGVDGPCVGSQLRAALDRLADEVKEGLRHGFFEIQSAT